MRILVATTELPYPANNGIRIPTFNVIRILAKHGHRICLVSYSESFDCPPELACLCDDVVLVPVDCQQSGSALFLKAALLNSMPFLMRYAANEFVRALRSATQAFRPHVVHLDTIGMTQFHTHFSDGVGTVGAINDSLSLTIENWLREGHLHGMQRILRRINLWKARRYEATTYPNLNVVHTMTRQDAEYLQSLCQDINTRVIPNGVDPALFSIPDAPSREGNLLFVGALGPDNLRALNRFLHESWPTVRANTDLKLHICGMDHGHLSSVNDTRVIVHGYVPNIKDIYALGNMAVVPIEKSSGILNKAIEAMAAGCVVFGLPKAMAAVCEGEQEVVITSKNTRAMADDICTLSSNRTSSERIRFNARRFAATRYSWDSRESEITGLYEAAYAQRNRRCRSSCTGSPSTYAS